MPVTISYDQIAPIFQMVTFTNYRHTSLLTRTLLYWEFLNKQNIFVV